MVFGDYGRETAGGGFDVLLLPRIRSAVFGYRSENTMGGGGGVARPEVSWSHAQLDRVGG